MSDPIRQPMIDKAIQRIEHGDGYEPVIGDAVDMMITDAIESNNVDDLMPAPPWHNDYTGDDVPVLQLNADAAPRMDERHRAVAMSKLRDIEGQLEGLSVNTTDPLVTRSMRLILAEVQCQIAVLSMGVAGRIGGAS